jgi:hypothetical protein
MMEPPARSSRRIAQEPAVPELAALGQPTARRELAAHSLRTLAAGDALASAKDRH